MTHPPVVVLGPTASGKSELSMAVARGVGGVEIVAVDAMQVYRRMDIGTAKPSSADQAAVRHHGLDLTDPVDDFTVHDYRRAYDEALADIDGRGGRPLVVAGTGLYLTAVLDRLELPGRWPDVRKDLDAELDPAVLHRRLADLDPLSAGRIEPTNRRRLARALEVTIGSGRPFSSFGPGVGAFPPTDTVQIGLRWPRPALAARVERRVHGMVAAGLVDEVRALRRSGMSATASQALGYKEFGDHLAGRVSLGEAIATIVTRTRQFAVRQERWFRRDPRVRWIDIDPAAPDPLHDARAALLTPLGS